MPSRIRLLYREAVTEYSPGLPRFAATLGNRVPLAINPNGVVTAGNPDATPMGLLFFAGPLTQGSREARQPWAVFRNRFAVNR
jgi:hypothetical protein